MRKGISLVALVITIIVLIILTAAVFLTGADVPANAELSVFFQDVGNVQDAVVLQIAENLSKKYSPIPEGSTMTEAEQDAMTKYDVILSEADTADILLEEPTTTKEVEGVKVWSIAASPDDLGLSITSDELAKYAIDSKGTVYYYNGGDGKVIDGVTYYKKDVTKTAQAGE